MIQSSLKQRASRSWVEAKARIGASEEGTFRAHMVMPDGALRDSVYFSVIAGEWPAVKARLVEKLRPELRR